MIMLFVMRNYFSPTLLARMVSKFDHGGDSNGNADLQVRSIIENTWEDYRIDAGLIELEQLVMTAMVSDGEAFVFLG